MHTRARTATAAGLAALVSVLGACGGGDEDAAAPPPAEGGGQTVEISGTEFAFDPSTVTVDAPGTVTFRLTNNGATEHALEIEGNGIEEETDTIGPGETAEVTVDLESGEYEMYCPVDDHRGQGMEGTVTVSG
jgi:plastocyanin